MMFDWFMALSPVARVGVAYAALVYVVVFVGMTVGMWYANRNPDRY